MTLESLCEMLDSLKNGFHAMIWLLLVPATILLVAPAIKPAQAVHHFTFHRIQHYEHAGSLRGSSAVSLNCEVRSLYSSSLARRCLVLSWNEFVSSDIGSLLQQGIVALIVTLPGNPSSLSAEQKLGFVESEQALLKRELQIPVYFVQDSPQVSEWLSSLHYHAGQNTLQTATEELLQQFTGDYYYLSGSLSSSKPITNVKPTNFFGKLTSDQSDSLPIILLVAHLDAGGVAPGLSYGANSGASGVAAVLEIVRILNELVKNLKVQPKKELAVLLSTAGKFNYLGSKKWLDEQSESMESGLLSRIQYVACLDAIGGEFPASLLVSRPPKEGSATAGLFETMNKTAEKVFRKPLPLVHKKINLADEELVWEHEQYSLAKVPAFTVSTSPSSKVFERKTILDTKNQVNVAELAKTVQILVKGIAGDLYDLKGSQYDITNDDLLKVSEEHLSSWVDLLTNQPRALPLLTADHPAVTAVKQFLTRNLNDVKVKQLVNEKGESEIIMHGPLNIDVTASRTKQPFFDLLVTAVIGLYAGLVYLLLKNVDVVRILQRVVQPLVASSSIKLRNGKAGRYQY